MIQGNQNQMNKALFALILHTLQEADLEKVSESKEEKSESENPHLDKGNSCTFIEI